MRSDSRFFVSNLQDDELIRQIDSLLETITESDKRIFLNYVELTRHIIELDKLFKSSPQSCVKVQPHQKHNVLRCEPNCHAFLSEERGQEQ
ncbi:hypothetical protein J8M93_01715 [Enterococcus faecium]|uniref:hypothetical protein n=1 Tax=Enterococcus faecium TaxID=1352 RepID=UPI003CEBD056